MALLVLSCPAGACCAGTAQLSVRAEAKRQATASAKRKRRRLALGKATFDLAAGKDGTIKVPLTGKGRALVAAAEHKGLRAQLAAAEWSAGPSS